MEFIQKAENFFAQLQYNLTIDPEPFLEDPETGKLQSLMLEPERFISTIEKFGIEYPFNAENKIIELKSLYKKDQIEVNDACGVIWRFYIQYWDFNEVILFKESEDRLYEALRRFNPNITNGELLTERQSYVLHLNKIRDGYMSRLFNPIMEENEKAKSEELNKLIDWDAERLHHEQANKAIALQDALEENDEGKRLVRQAQELNHKGEKWLLDLKLLEDIHEVVFPSQEQSNKKSLIEDEKIKAQKKFSDAIQKQIDTLRELANSAKEASDRNSKILLGISDTNKEEDNSTLDKDGTSDKPSPKKESTKEIGFKNKFNNKSYDFIYNHFKEGLVNGEREYLSEKKLKQWIEEAFGNFDDKFDWKNREEEDYPDPIENRYLFTNTTNAIRIIKDVFYRFYQICGSPKGEAPKYSTLCGNYFEEETPKKVLGNWQKLQREQAKIKER